MRDIASQPLRALGDVVTSGFDVSAQTRIVALLEELLRDSGLSLVRSLCDQVLILRQGEVVEQGEAAAIIAQPRHANTRELLGAIPLPEPDPGWRERETVA